jgi:hypothetical protein
MNSGKLFLFFFAICLLFLNSCGIEKAGEPDKNLIYIASDFLYPKDTTLFKEYCYNTSRIQIIHIDTDSLDRKLNHEGYSSLIDLMILESSLDLVEFSKSGKLQRIYSEEHLPEISSLLKGSNNDWFGLAIDPIVIGLGNKNIEKISNYGDLNKSISWASKLNETETEAALCGILHRLEKHSDRKEWLSRFFMKKQAFRNIQDTIGYKLPLLNTYSSFYADSSLYRNYILKGKVVFPNQRKGGANYVLRGVGLIKQCRNYDLACDFIKYLFRDDQNQRINNWWNTFPVTYGSNGSYAYQQYRFKRYPVSMESLSSYLGESKMLNKAHFQKKKANL